MDMMQQLLTTPLVFMKDYGLPFLVVLSVLVFVHEWGHYIIARLNGVRVQVFSIGFGPELFGRTDRHGTRWKFSLIPLGGYVQMFGDIDPASAGHDEKISDDERKVAFFAQPVSRRAAIVFAGPAINYLFAVLVLAGVYMYEGQPYAAPVAAAVIEGSPAEKAGIRPDDKIISINGQPVARFNDIRKIVMLNLDAELKIELLRSTGKDSWADKPRTVLITPELRIEEDRFGFKHSSGRIGIKSPGGYEVEHHTPLSAVKAAGAEVISISRDTLSALGQMILGTRSADELGGILRIGAYAGEYAQQGVVAMLIFAALLSVNLGLINLLPIPMLDGGHLAMYAMEKMRGKALGEKVQEYAFRVGLVFLLGIMILATWNDLVQLKIVDYVVKLVT